MTRAQWNALEIERIKAGDTMRQRCCMALEDRVAAGLCLGDVPEERAHKALVTCSVQCQADKKRLRRWELSKTKCRSCGRGFTKAERAALDAERRAKIEQGVSEISDTEEGD